MVAKLLRTVKKRLRSLIDIVSDPNKSASCQWINYIDYQTGKTGSDSTKDKWFPPNSNTTRKLVVSLRSEQH